MQAENYKTINSFAEYRFKEKGSLFIGQAFPITTEEEALSILNGVRKKLYDATHHCYAYVLPGLFKYSDAGEPSGTAGIRIYNAIQHFDLLELLVIVIRYFGGTKLGVGPLGKAYYFAAEETLKMASIVTRTAYKNLTLCFDFPMISHVHHLLSLQAIKITDTKYEEGVTMDCLVKPADIQLLIQRINETAFGKVQVEQTDKWIYL